MKKNEDNKSMHNSLRIRRSVNKKRGNNSGRYVHSI